MEIPFLRPLYIPLYAHSHINESNTTSIRVRRMVRPLEGDDAWACLRLRVRILLTLFFFVSLDEWFPLAWPVILWTS
jgi:hypothetical protein